jgi:hypothetical protein
MTKSSASMFSPTLELPDLTKKLTRRVNRRKMSAHSEKLFQTVPPPSEEVLIKLNRVGQEYPFCVYYKQKVNDPL